MLLMILSLSLLTSCKWWVRTETAYVYLPVEIPTAPHPRGLNLLDIKFDVVTEENLDQFIAENKDRNGTLVFYAIDVEDYESMAINQVELKRYITQQMSIITYYEDQVAFSKEQAEKLNVQETE